MNRVVLQVPVSADLRKAAESEAKAQGFSSLQDAVRMFLNKLASKMIEVRLGESVQLSKRNASRYEKMVEDVQRGRIKAKAFDDVDSLIKHLNK